MNLPTSKKVQERLQLAKAASRFALSRDYATDCAKTGDRNSARWWGQTARNDWQHLQDLLTR
jgi:hypothetical protein